jgi:hypothetical protein
MLYQSRQGEDARRKLEKRHYGEETRKKVYYSKHMGCNLPLYMQQSVTDEDIKSQSQHQQPCRVNYTACILRLGLRAYGPWLRCRVTACRVLQHRIRCPISLLHNFESADVQYTPESRFSAWCQVHALPLLLYPSRRDGCYGSMLLRYRRNGVHTRWPGPWPSRLSLIAKACRAQSRHVDRVRKLNGHGGKDSVVSGVVH